MPDRLPCPFEEKKRKKKGGRQHVFEVSNGRVQEHCERFEWLVLPKRTLTGLTPHPVEVPFQGIVLRVEVEIEAENATEKKYPGSMLDADQLEKLLLHDEDSEQADRNKDRGREAFGKKPDCA